MFDPKMVHATDQFIAHWGTLGAGFAAFLREAKEGGATRAEALQGASAALAAWFMSAKQGGTDGGA